MRSVAAAVFAALVVGGSASGGVSEFGGRAAAGTRGLAVVPVVSGLLSPVHVAEPRGEPSRLYVVEQAGRIRVLVNGVLRAQPFLDIRGRVLSGGERGLLSVAFHPNYAQNRLFFVNYTNLNGDTRVVRFQSDGAQAILESAKVVLAVAQPYANHNGGQLAFGPDGLLYVGMGDGGSAGDPDNRAQTLSDPLGKLLRRDVDAAEAGWRRAGYGLRNPWRFSFDRATGDLLLTDVGQRSWEELDYRSSAQLPGVWNYGWSVYEGNHPYDTSRSLLGPWPYVPPIAEYAHTNGNCSITGGFVYRGASMPAARGRYFFGDYCSGTIWSLRIVKGAAVDKRTEPFAVGRLSSFGEDARGELYLVSRSGTIYRLTGT